MRERPSKGHRRCDLAKLGFVNRNVYPYMLNWALRVGACEMDCYFKANEATLPTSELEREKNKKLLF